LGTILEMGNSFSNGTQYQERPDPCGLLQAVDSPFLLGLF
jgi:hypothetical protein